MKTYLTAPQVARMFGVNIPTVRRYIRSGELPAAKVGRSYVVAGDDIDKYIEARKSVKRAEVSPNGERRRRAARTDRARTRGVPGSGVRDRIWSSRPSSDAGSGELVEKRCPRCELVYAATPENFTFDQGGVDGPGPWCRQCAMESRRQPSENDGRFYVNAGLEV